MGSRRVRIETIINILSYVIALIAFASVLREVKTAYVLLCTGLLALSAFLTWFGRLVTRRWMLNILAVAVIVSRVIGLDPADLITQMIETLMVLLCIKFLEQKKSRDHMQIYVISLLLVAGSGLLSMSMVFVVIFLCLLLVMTPAAILLSYFAQDGDMKLTVNVAAKIVRNSLLIPCLAVPLAMVMFVILPRTNYPLFSFLNKPERGHSGFSDEVTLGSVSSIQETTAVVLRVNMEKTGDDNLYWRGVVLDYFDGVSWKSLGKKTAPPSGGATPATRVVTQTVYMEPSGNKRLFALDKPVYVGLRNARRLEDGTFISSGSFGRRVRYEAGSIISDHIAANKVDTDRYLQLPSNISARTASLIRDLGRGKTDNEKIAAFHQYLRNGKFKYSLDNLPVTKNPLDTFLFQTEYGNCEYFASAYVVMLRLSGIPARMVGGYRGGYYNGMGRYYLVSEKDAHVWAEAYLRGKGWLRIDPTPPSPSGFGSGKNNLILRTELLLDSFNYYWYAFVINYNFDKQARLVYSLRSALRKPRVGLSFDRGRLGPARYLGIFIVVGALCVLLRDFRVKRLPVEDRILRKFLRKMEKSGYRKMPHQGLEEFVASVGDEKVRMRALRFVSEFEEFYYRDQKAGRDQVRHFISLIRSI